MPFNPNQPLDTTKLRNCPQMLRDNFQAIVDGDPSFSVQCLNLINRNSEDLQADPVPIANTSILYSKTSANGNTDLYVMNSLGKSIQLTSGTPDINNEAGNSTLLGGAQLLWGNQVMWNGMTITISTIKEIYNVVLCIQKKNNNTLGIGVSSVKGNKFVICMEPKQAYTVYYQVIGK